MMFRNLNILLLYYVDPNHKREDTYPSGMVKGRFGPDA